MKKIVETYIKNQEGIWGNSADGFSAGIFEVQQLWFPELMFEPFSEIEIESAVYTKARSVRKNNRLCNKIIVSLPTTTSFLQKSTGESTEILRERSKIYLSNRAFKYEFLIDSEEKIIVSRKHYNAQGNMIFETPSGIKGQFVEQSFFASRVLKKMIENDKKEAQKYYSIPYIFWNWMLSHGKWLMAAIALAAIVLVVIIKHSNKINHN